MQWGCAWSSTATCLGNAASSVVRSVLSNQVILYPGHRAPGWLWAALKTLKLSYAVIVACFKMPCGYLVV